MWTWVSGSKDTQGYSSGQYGKLNQPSVENSPPSSYYPMTWIDSNDNLWMYGGRYYNSENIERGVVDYGDMWKFNGSHWTWVWSTSNSKPNHGKLNVATCLNHPGDRVHAVTWVDAFDHLYLWSGFTDAFGNFRYFNDMWKFDGDMWTWVGGPTTASLASDDNYSYGELRVPNASNLPRGRERCAKWVDSQFNLWIFGGAIFSQDTVIYFNDLWRWDGTYWTWISGSSSPDQPTIHGTIGIPSITTVPGARYAVGSFIDALDHLWVFGGFGPLGSINELWKWDGIYWTWYLGTTTWSGIDNYPPTLDVLAFSNPTNNSFYIFGGRSGDAMFDDLWRFIMPNLNASNTRASVNSSLVSNRICVPVTDELTITPYVFVNGDNTTWSPGVYGTKGVANSTYRPRARSRGRGWTDSMHNFWIIGGRASNNMSKFLFLQLLTFRYE